MHESDRQASERARARRNLVTRQEFLAAGGSDRRLEIRRRDERLIAVHAGVYTVASAPLDWRTQMLAACLAAGDLARTSHRAAVLLWGLDGILNAPLELLVPYTHGPVQQGVIVHRTRRVIVPALVDGIPVTTVERTLLDAAGCLPRLVVEKALESAIRRGLTTERKVARTLETEGGQGVWGSPALRRILAGRPEGRAAGSAAEVEFWKAIEGRVEPPVRQYRLDLGRGDVAVLDTAWPPRRKAVEIDGLDAHSSSWKLDDDLDRQNRVWDVGWELRRYSARRVRRDPRAWPTASCVSSLIPAQPERRHEL